MGHAAKQQPNNSKRLLHRGRLGAILLQQGA
jgi:hypothetical protein